MGKNVENVNKVDVVDTLDQGKITPVEDGSNDEKVVDPKDLEEAMRIVERKKKIKAAGEKALGVAKMAGLVVLGGVIGAIAFKGKGANGSIEATSDSVGDTEDTSTDVEDTVVDDDVEVENE